ncbi:MAG: alcohol dehydrogenase, partial [Natronomonas sp.]|nr:alcohol dehydrogenase [Natronomonas sp.]
MPLEHAAVTEPTSIATRALFDQVTTPGDTLLVEGPGPIGVRTAAVANSMDANVLGFSQGAENRLPLLESLGIDSFDVEVRDLGDVMESFT